MSVARDESSNPPGDGGRAIVSRAKQQSKADTYSTACKREYEFPLSASGAGTTICPSHCRSSSFSAAPMPLYTYRYTYTGSCGPGASAARARPERKRSRVPLFRSSAPYTTPSRPPHVKRVISEFLRYGGVHSRTRAHETCSSEIRALNCP